MEILQENNEKSGAFYVEIANERLAEMTYVWSGAHLFIIDHTEVSDRLAGKGVGKQLVSAAVTFARENNHRIIPVCPFAKSVFDRVEAFRDVLFHPPASS